MSAGFLARIRAVGEHERIVINKMVNNMKIHGIKIKYPLLLLAIFLTMDVVTVWWLEIFQSAIFPDTAPVIIAMWLLGFISDDWKA